MFNEPYKFNPIENKSENNISDLAKILNRRTDIIVDYTKSTGQIVNITISKGVKDNSWSIVIEEGEDCFDTTFTSPEELNRILIRNTINPTNLINQLNGDI